MLVREYLEKLGSCQSVVFIKTIAVKDSYSPMYHASYEDTPINTAHEWLNGSWYLDYFILNDKQHPIEWLSGAGWGKMYEAGRLKSLLIISPEDLAKLGGGEEQRAHLIHYIDTQIAKN